MHYDDLNNFERTHSKRRGHCFEVQKVSRVQKRAVGNREGVRLGPEYVHLRQPGEDRRGQVLRDNEAR